MKTIPAVPTAEVLEQARPYIPWLAEAEITPLVGGRSNFVWRIQSGTRAVVLKQYVLGENPLFANSARNEAMVLKHLRAAPFAPEVIAAFGSGSGECLLYHAAPGSAWREGAAQVGHVMRDLHAIDLPEFLHEFLPERANGSQALLAQAERILDRCLNAERVRGARPRLAVSETDTRVLLHCDIVPGNVIVGERSVHLIDWQCPAIGDACEDIASFLSPAMQLVYRGFALDAAEEEAFWDAYGAHKARYRALAPAYHFRMAAYCQWKLEQGERDYAAGLEAELAALSATR